MVRVRSAHVGGDGEIYAYVRCDGHVRRVGREAFKRDGVVVVETCYRKERGGFGDRQTTLQAGNRS